MIKQIKDETDTRKKKLYLDVVWIVQCLFYFEFEDNISKGKNVYQNRKSFFISFPQKEII